MDEILDEFLVEAAENVDALDRELVELESDPTSSDLLASIFRGLHTLKGTSGFLALPHLESLAHAAENLLSELRDERLVVRTDIMDALLAAVDNIRLMLITIEETGSDGEDDHAELIHRLAKLAEAGEPAATPAPPEPAVPSGGQHVADSSIRVDVGLLDQLMNLVGELVLARNRVLQHEITTADDSFRSTSQQLNLITSELQESVMKTRMQPIGTIWSKLPRVVRDLAADGEKLVRLEMDGEDTELDKTLVEAIKDPLTHIVRNAIDHGIESPAERTANGKEECGLLQLRAFHQGGLVIIEISDDGAGIDLERVRRKAVTTGVLSEDQARELGDRETAMLIFQPGLSTAEQVTTVSGRGVGMDVVKTNVESIGGSLELQSRPGEGMTLTLRIPLTLAIIPALVVGCGRERFLIPLINLVEVLHIGDASTGTRIENVAGADVVRLRGNLLPIVSLRAVLGLNERDTDDTGHNLIILQADGCRFGLVVDTINDTEEIVVKPLSAYLQPLGAYAGTTIMGDGAVSLIIDVPGVARLGGIDATAESPSVEDDPTEGGEDRSGATTLVLVCTVGSQRVGVPLSFVSRLEEFDRNTIEFAAGQEVIQYRGRLLRLVRVCDVVGIDTEPTEHETIHVLVHETESGLYGFAVDRIIDVLEADLSTGEPSDHPAFTMSGVIGHRVTDLLDVDELIAHRARSGPTTRAAA